MLTRLSETVSAQTGLMFDGAQWFDLRRALQLVAVDTKRDWRACAQWFLSEDGAAQLPLLIDQLTIGETYFFRDDALFAALREVVLPELIARRRSVGRLLKLWCAGCSSGEEPYSLAIELIRQLPDYRQWSISLLATDINHRFLDKAERGIYGAWSLRDKSPAALSPFIKPLDKERFEVISTLRQLVSFSHLNLVSDEYPAPANRTSDVDIILCRHVLMYLRPEVAREVIARLSRSLAEGGWLITSSIEGGLVDRAELKPVRLHDIVLFRKCSDTAFAQVIPNTIKLADAATTHTALEPDNIAAPAAESMRYEMPAATATNAEDNLLSAELAAARSFADQGRLEDACAACARAIAVDKLNSEAHFLQATILLELGDTQTAERAFERTLYLDSDHISAHMALAMLALRTERRYDATRHFRNARELLRTLPRDFAVPGSDGLTAHQLSAMIDTLAV